MIAKIVSGGQTGADRAALDVAIRHGLPHGGWCPRGREAEDGVISEQYRLTETPLVHPSQRTEWNVRDSDATVVFTLGAQPAGGSLLTIETAARLRKPCLHLSVSDETYDDRALVLRQFVSEKRIVVLNVAGSRESEEPGIYSWVWRVLEDAFFWSANRPDLLG